MLTATVARAAHEAWHTCMCVSAQVGLGWRGRALMIQVIAGVSQTGTQTEQREDREEGGLRNQGSGRAESQGGRWSGGSRGSGGAGSGVDNEQGVREKGGHTFNAQGVSGGADRHDHCCRRIASKHGMRRWANDRRGVSHVSDVDALNTRDGHLHHLGFQRWLLLSCMHRLTMPLASMHGCACEDWPARC